MPDCIIVSVGGGGLICGVIEGLIKNGWINKNIKVIAVETVGCDCFNKSTKERKLVTLENISRSEIKKSLNENNSFDFQFLFSILNVQHCQIFRRQNLFEKTT